VEGGPAAALLCPTTQKLMWHALCLEVGFVMLFLAVFLVPDQKIMTIPIYTLRRLKIAI